MEEIQESINMDSALKSYINHLNAVKKYQKSHPEDISKKMKRFYENRKTNNPEAYKALLEKKKEQYKFKKLQKLQNPEISN